MSTRTLARVVPSMSTSDGAGVRLRRSIGSASQVRLDPFLMLDEFGSDAPSDYIAGFPAHPHRGFETVTYMLEGHMRHEDHMGNQGDLADGDVQWMTAGRGIVHSEMPQQTEGRMRGFQLWLNLPSHEKMQPAAYRDIPAAQIPVVELPGGIFVKVIAGTLQAQTPVSGPINPLDQRISTDPLYLDVHLPADTVFTQPVAAQHNALVYVYEGELRVAGSVVPKHAAGILSAGETIAVRSGTQGARLLILAARPIGEPVVQYGPFVMNTRQEIEQAISDYQSGVFTRAA